MVDYLIEKDKNGRKKEKLSFLTRDWSRSRKGQDRPKLTWIIVMEDL